MSQLNHVYRVMRDRGWRTLEEISFVTGYPPASVSARLRDLRKDQYGGFEVERRRSKVNTHGKFEYRVRR